MFIFAIPFIVVFLFLACLQASFNQNIAAIDQSIKHNHFDALQTDFEFKMRAYEYAASRDDKAAMQAAKEQEDRDLEDMR